MLSPENVLRLRNNTLKPSDQPSTTADLAPKTNNHGRSHSTENILSISARRRFSNVSDVVSRKLSNTIGWKIPPPTPVPTQEIVTQGKCLCGQYIRHRLKRSGVFNKRLALQRIRSIIGTPSVHVVREVFPALNYVGEELERMHPKLFSGVARQLCRPGGGELQSVESVVVTLATVSRDLFRADITWSKIVALFALAAGLSVDCVRQNRPEYLPKLMEGIAEVIEDELVAWINENGGWLGFVTHVSPKQNQCSYTEWAALVIGFAFSLFVLYFLFRFIGCHLISLLIKFETSD